MTGVAAFTISISCTTTVRPLPGVDATLALRRLLKFAARSCGLRCTSIRDPAVLDDGPQGLTDEIVAHTPQNGGNT
jgi:hypothetical protein